MMKITPRDTNGCKNGCCKNNTSSNCNNSCNNKCPYKNKTCSKSQQNSNLKLKFPLIPHSTWGSRSKSKKLKVASYGSFS